MFGLPVLLLSPFAGRIVEQIAQHLPGAAAAADVAAIASTPAIAPNATGPIATVPIHGG